MVLPAAVLFATVFSIGAFTRHSEVTAAKASGMSFHRLIVPILFGAIFACVLDLGLGEVVPITNQRRSQLLHQDKAQVGTSRFNFAFASDLGRVYKAYELRTDSGQIRQLQIERKGQSATYPTYILTADSASYDRAAPVVDATARTPAVVSDRSRTSPCRSRRRGTLTSPSARPT